MTIPRLPLNNRRPPPFVLQAGAPNQELGPMTTIEELLTVIETFNRNRQFAVAIGSWSRCAVLRAELKAWFEERNLPIEFPEET